MKRFYDSTSVSRGLTRTKAPQTNGKECEIKTSRLNERTAAYDMKPDGGERPALTLKVRE